jgi:large subunit ribosomal protein L9
VKVIFIEDVPNVARVGQTKTVADGYARNYLFPRKLAVLADSQASAAIEAQLKKKMKLRALEEAEMAELAKIIGGLEITLKAKVGENDKLYGSITGADIAEALSKAAGWEIDKRKIELAEPIKQAGTCDVTVRFAHEISAVIKVNVISDEAVEAKPEKKAEKTEEKKEKAVKKEKKEKKEKPVKAAKAEKPVKAEKEEKPPKEEKAEKPVKAEKEEKEEKPAKAEKEEKLTKEKKVKAAKAVKEETPEKEVKPETEEKPEKVAKPETEVKKEKKPRAKARKTEAAVEEKKES